MTKYSIGLDFGTLSVRGVLVNISNGEIVAAETYDYPHKIMKNLPDGTPLPAHSAYAHPADYMEGLQYVTKALKDKADEGEIVSIGVDATSCSVIPLSRNGTPLCLSKEFADHPHAYIKLWKHHTAESQAHRLQRAAEERGERFLSFCGGNVNAESFFPKALETFEEDRAVWNATSVFLDVGEWITLILTGKLTCSEPIACFKRLYHPFKGYPEAAYFESVAPEFSAVLSKLRGKMLPVGAKAGDLHETASDILGLPAGIAVAAPQVDAHTALAAVGGKPGDMVCVVGTSGVTLMCSHSDTGMDGIYSSSAHCFLPDTYGHEGGQSALGDTLGWFARHCVPPKYHDAALEKEIGIQQYLTNLAAKQKAGDNGLLALNWWGGVRTPLMDYSLAGTLLGLTLQTKPEDIYRALIEAGAYSFRQIRDIFRSHGHNVSRIFLCGGIPNKNELLCQIYANVFGMEVQVCNFTDSCALGSAIMGAFAYGEDKPEVVADNMRCRDLTFYYPDFDERDVYDVLYDEYLRLTSQMSDYNSVMRHVQNLKKGDHHV